MHHQKPKYHVTVLIIGIGLIVGVTLFLLLSFVLWKVGFQYFSVVLKSGIHTVGRSLDLLMQIVTLRIINILLQSVFSKET